MALGLAAIGTVMVGMPFESVAVMTWPVVTVVLPVFVAPAVQVLETAEAVNWPAEMQEVSVPGQVLAGWATGWTEASEVTCPPESVPCVLTLVCPELKSVAGP